MTRYLLILLLVVNPVAAEIYKWVDEEGRVHYSDTVNTDKPVEKVEVTINSYKHVSYETLPSNVYEPAKSVIMYSTSWCGYCKKARNYFLSKDIPFKEFDIEKDRRAKRKYDTLGGQGVPVILVGKKRMNGFSIAGFNQIYQ